MADRKISDLTALTAPAAGDYLPIVDISEVAAASKNKRITIEELFRGVPLGTAAAPSIAIEGDENTGIYSPGANQLAVATNGTGRLFVDANGNVNIDSGTLYVDAANNVVGIGSANPSAYGSNALLVNNNSLTINQDGASEPILQFRSGTATQLGRIQYPPTGLRFVNVSGAAETLRITSTGLVGIGTSSPGALIDITASAPEARISSSNTAQTLGSSVGKLTFYTSDTTTPGGAGVATTLETLSSTSNGSDYRFVITKREGSGGGSCFINLGGSADGSISFGTNTSGAGTERLRIDSSGRLGLGTSSPGELLDVAGNIRQTGNTAGTANTVGLIDFYNANNTTTIARINVRTDGAANSGSYRISTASAGTLNEVIRIDSSGRVGIGTTTPSQTLHVVSSINQALFEGATQGNITIQKAGTAGMGLYSNAAGTLAFYDNAGGVERARIDSSGRLGLGTSAPSAAKLDIWPASLDAVLRGSSGVSTQVPAFELKGYNINGVDAGLDIRTYQSGTAQDRVRITYDGRVGIGVTDPGSYNSAAANLVIGSTTANSGLTIRSGTAGVADRAGSIYFADGTSGNEAYRGYIDYTHNNDTLTIGTAGLPRAIIDSSGRLLVGTTTDFTPTSGTAQINGATALSLFRDGNFCQQFISSYRNNTNHSILNFRAARGSLAVPLSLPAGDSIGSLVFAGYNAAASAFQESARIDAQSDAEFGTADDATDSPGRLVFSTTADGASSPTERMRITSTGQLRLAGAGITFNGDTATANELDDYEEGTFTPTISGLGTAGTLTYTRQTGRYVKVGGIVHVSVELKIDAISVAPTSDLVLGGFPFTSANIESNFAYTGALRTNGVDLPAGAAGVFGIILNNDTIARLQVNTDDGSPAGILGSGISAGDEFGFTTSYRTV